MYERQHGIKHLHVYKRWDNVADHFSGKNHYHTVVHSSFHLKCWISFCFVIFFAYILDCCFSPIFTSSHFEFLFLFLSACVYICMLVCMCMCKSVSVCALGIFSGYWGYYKWIWDLCCLFIYSTAISHEIKRVPSTYLFTCALSRRSEQLNRVEKWNRCELFLFSLSFTFYFTLSEKEKKNQWPNWMAGAFSRQPKCWNVGWGGVIS